jgi:2,4'-dihydroxyacetophenone dioxygenase
MQPAAELEQWTGDTMTEATMTETTLTPAASSTLLTARGHRDFIDVAALPWTPWVMEGTHFKLLAINELTGGFTMLLKVDPGVQAPVHAHLGTAEAYLVEGGFYYEADQPGHAGCYTYERGGSVHQPVSPQGCVMFAITHAPLAGCHPDGSIAAVVDCHLMLQLAQQAGVASHVVRLSSSH